LSESELDSAIHGQHRLTLPLAPPEPLILWEVRYPFDFDVLHEQDMAKQTRFWRRVRDQAQVAIGLADRLQPVTPGLPARRAGT
ncbi:MAG TPA: hypothetical protein VEY07_06495, partial [Thermoplasmata archaeon]|nr:hypothetical protein [Thermoplasmata archaeon]